MRIGHAILLLGTALLAVACGEAGPSDEEARYAEQALEELDEQYDSGALERIPTIPVFGSDETPEADAARNGLPPDLESRDRPDDSFLADIGRWGGIRAFWTFLGGGGVLVMLVIMTAAFLRRTALSMDLAIRSSRRRYLNRCLKSSRDRKSDPR